LGCKGAAILVQGGQTLAKTKALKKEKRVPNGGSEVFAKRGKSKRRAKSGDTAPEVEKQKRQTVSYAGKKE